MSRLIGNQLVETDRSCRVVSAPGVVPADRANFNMLVPDLAVTCRPPDGHAVAAPVVLIEILSPSNAAETRANVRAYASIPSVMEIVVISSVRVFAEMLRRRPDGTWPAQADFLTDDAELRLETLGFAAPLRAAYRTPA